MKFTVKASDLVSALSVVSCVTPKAITPNGVPGYYFNLTGGTLSIYSRDTQTVAKTTLEVSEDEGGECIYPAANVTALKYLGDQEILFQAHKTEDSFTVSYSTDTGVMSKKLSVDPEYFVLPDSEIESAKGEDTFPALVLSHMLSTVRPFVAEPKDTKVEDHFKTVQMFSEGEGDGFTYAATGTMACFAYCESFKGKSLAVHGQHLGALLDFLSQVKGDVTVKHSTNMEIFESEDGKIFGFARNHKSHSTFRTYGLDKDEYVLSVPKKQFQDVLAYARAEMDTKDNSRVRLVYDHSRSTLRILFDGEKSQTETFAVPVTPKDGMKGDKDWVLTVNPDYLHRVTQVISHEIEIRVSLIEQRGRAMGMLRTYEAYRVDDNGKPNLEGEHECQVYRWAASKE